MGQITRGVQKVEMGAIGAGGIPGTVLTVLGYTDADSTAQITEEDPTYDDLRALEVDGAIDREVTAGITTFVFSLLNPDLQALAKLFGGTITGTGSAATWGRPRVPIVLEQTVKITPKKGYIFTIPRGQVSSKINYDLTKPGKFVVDIVVTVLIPEDEDTDQLIIGALVA